MFKFMKSKKGFTLVELMIVVVIMAILVAVAVPIYSAVTKNARKKTCLANQREIISTVGNYCMMNSQSINGSFKITTGDEGDSGSFGSWNGLSSGQQATITASFQTIPYCPVANAVITVTMTPGTDTTNVLTACSDVDDSHTLNAAA